MIRFSPVLLLVLLGGCGDPPALPKGPPPPAVEIRASVDKAVATTGDRITYTVEVEHAAAIEVTVPETGAEIAGLRILDTRSPKPEREGDRIIERRIYELRADLVGSYVLPEITVRYRLPEAPPEAEPELAQTSKIFLEVQSVLPEDGSATDIHDLKPVVAQARGLSPALWIAMALGTLVLGAALVLGWRRRRRIPVVPAVPPHEVAYAALDQLRETDFDDPPAVRRFYFALSEVVRAYVEARFGLNATDLTAEEILKRLRDLPELSSALRELLQSFLLQTDAVKFADHRPVPEEIHARYEEALRFIEQTIPAPTPAPAAEGTTP